VGRCGLDSCCSGWGPLAGCYIHGYEPSNSINGGEFPDYSSVTISFSRKTSTKLISYLVMVR
jgi:hypothetical protein